MADELSLPVRTGMAHVLSRRGRTLPLVLLHGAGGNHRSFDELVGALPADVEVAIPALPGRAGSSGPACASVAEAAAFLVELCDALGYERVCVAGHSFGGAVALEFAITQPARVAGLCLLATGARLRVHPTILAVMEEAVRRGTPANAASAGFLPGTPAALLASFAARNALTPPESALADWRAANGFDRMEALPSLEVKTLVVAGERDSLTPRKYADYLVAHLPHARLELIPHAGHMFPVEHAAVCAALLSDFVQTL